MASFVVHDVSGSEVGSYEFDPAELASSINKQLLHDVVVMYEANKRVGTVRTKSARRSHRQHEKALPPKRNGPGPGGFPPHAHSPRRRPRVRQTPAGFQLSPAEKSGPPGHADGPAEQI